MPEWKMGGWVREKAQKVQLEISEEGAQTLVQKVGTDMVYLQKALEQLSIYLYPQKSASVEDIKSLSVPGGEAEIFSFLDAVGSRQTEKAIRLLESMAAESGLAMMLYQRVRELLMVRLGQNKGIEQVAMAQNLGLHPFRLKNLWEQAKQYSVTELKTALQDLIRIQTGQVMGRLGKATVAVVLEWWLVKWGVNRLSAIARRP